MNKARKIAQQTQNQLFLVNSFTDIYHEKIYKVGMGIYIYIYIYTQTYIYVREKWNESDKYVENINGRKIYILVWMKFYSIYFADTCFD